MKMIKRLLLVFGILFVVFLASSYHSGIEVEELKPKYLTPESDFVSFEGMDIHYRKTGTGPVLFLMHGVSSSLHTWEVWQKSLSKDFTVVSVDLPSFGLTGPHPKNDYSVEMYMRAIDRITEVLELDTMYIGGNSYGGYLSWNYAVHQPEKVKKVILLDAAGYEIDGFQDLGFQLMANKNLSFIASKFTPKFVIKQSVKNVYGNPSLVTEELVDRYYDLLLRKGNRTGFIKILQAQNDWQTLNDKIKQVKQATLIVWGSEDKILPVEAAHFFHRDIPNSELKIYEGIGHVPMEEIAEETAQLARDFLLK